MKRREPIGEDFQMAPMIDMVFLLLVFFMCVSNLAQAERSFPVELPESFESKVPEDLSDRGIVTVAADGSIYLGPNMISIEAFEEVIRQGLSQNPDLRVQVRADQGTEFGAIRKVLQACARAGAYQVIYAAYEAS